MEIRPAAAADLAPLAAGLARLDLMRRYGRDEPRLAADLARAHARGDGLLLAVEEGRPAGLAWFLRQGTLGLGGYLKLMAVLPGARSRGVGSAAAGRLRGGPGRDRRPRLPALLRLQRLGAGLLRAPRLDPGGRPAGAGAARRGRADLLEAAGPALTAGPERVLTSQVRIEGRAQIRRAQAARCGGTGSPAFTSRISISERSASARVNWPATWALGVGDAAPPRSGRAARRRPGPRATAAGASRRGTAGRWSARRAPAGSRSGPAPAPCGRGPGPSGRPGRGGGRRGGGKASSRYSSMAEDSASQKSPWRSAGTRPVIDGSR